MDYPEPLVFEPLQQPHLQTFIFLHGRGSWAEELGPELLRAPIRVPEPGLVPGAHGNGDDSSANATKKTPRAEEAIVTLQTAFPHARFVFPTAARRRATIYKRALTRQWFDSWKLDPPATDREELQVGGLRETTGYLQQLLRAEILLVPGGARNVVLGGLSQGCAASLVALLLWEGEELGAAVGMCGRLPFAEGLMGVILDKKSEEEDCEVLGFDPFAADSRGGDEASGGAADNPAERAVAWLSEQLGLPAPRLTRARLPVQNIPIFLGHGARDEKVSIELGRRASECLGELAAGVCWKEYDDLGHWYSGDVLKDLVLFLIDVFNKK